MEEQADTKKTRTEITDQETKHASHTQHTMPTRGEASTSATFDDVSLLDRSMYYQAHAVQTPIEQQMYFDTAQLPSFTSPDTFSFLHFRDTNFGCQQQSIYTTLTYHIDLYHGK